MPRRRLSTSRREIAARNVFDPNARTTRGFAGRIVGRFVRLGPNSWDPYALAPEDGPPIDVLPGVEIVIEDRGTRFRMRWHGSVVQIEWTPDETDGASPDADRRARFLESCVTPFANKAGIGAAAFIAKTLR